MPTSSPTKLTETEIAMALSDLPAWKVAGGKLHRHTARPSPDRYHDGPNRPC